MRRLTYVAVLIVVVGVALSWSSTARAVVLFDNFGPNNSYNGNTGWTVIKGGPIGAHIEQAAHFSVTGGDVFLDSVEFAVGHLFGPNVMHVSLHAEENGGPGPVLQTVTVLDQILPMPTEPTNNNPPVPAIFGGTTVLQDGGNYWLSMSSDTSVSDSWLAWNYNTTGDTGRRGERTDGGPWLLPPTGFDPRGAMRINVTPVPEPAAAGVLGLVAVALKRRRGAGGAGSRRA